MGMSASGFCGVTAAAITAAVCNRQSRTIKADVSGVEAYLTSTHAAIPGALTGSRVFALPEHQPSVPFVGEPLCVAVRTGGTLYAETAEQNASCSLHHRIGAAAGGNGLGLGLVLSSITLRNLCTCKAGVEQCNGGAQDEWVCDDTAQTKNAKLKLCPPSSQGLGFRV
jgi:hypothetical protein